MKNVTGYDLARTLAGSWGTLAALTEVTFKVAPVPESTCTLIVLGLPDAIGVEVLCAAMGTPFEVTGAAHLQQAVATSLAHAGLASQGKSITAIRIENTPQSIDYRRDRLADLLQPYGRVHDLDTDNSVAFWEEVRRLRFLAGEGTQVWRISTTPTKGPDLVAALARYMECRAFYDWSGGLVWLETPATADAGAADVRRVVATYGGHATLMRAEPAVRAAVDVFQPQQPGTLRLMRHLKSSFDPGGILNPGRMTQHY
jgi:glycolate oxidase FAD binding subunit